MKCQRNDIHLSPLMILHHELRLLLTIIFQVSIMKQRTKKEKNFYLM